MGKLRPKPGPVGSSLGAALTPPHLRCFSVRLRALEFCSEYHFAVNIFKLPPHLLLLTTPFGVPPWEGAGLPSVPLPQLQVAKQL